MAAAKFVLSCARTMTIYFDLSAAAHRRAGLGRYAESLARALIPLLDERLAFFYNAEEGVEPGDGLERLPARTVSLGYKPWRMAVWLGQVSHVPFNRLLPGAELYHATEHLLMHLRSVPTVLTVHDLIFRRYPAHHKPLNRWYLNLTMPLYCRRATRIIAVSEQTKRDLVEAYGIAPEKIRVIYEAAAPGFQPQAAEDVTRAKQRYGLPERYLLSVGTIEPRKNLGRVLRAFERLRCEGMVDAFVIVGKRGWLYDDFFAQLEQSPAKQAVIFPGWVEDDDLPAIYAGASAVAFPSEFEGFGLPALEAMACGAPVVCSNTSSLPEIAGDAALLVTPTDTDEVTDALRRVVREPGLAEEMRRCGYAQAAKFSWERAARETLAVYERALARASSG
jgi:glycosyltransferase involved in cell wall biosynthesis